MRIQKVDDKSVVIIDNFLKSKDFDAIQNLINGGVYSQLKSTLRRQKFETPHTSIIMEPSDFCKTDLFGKLSQQIRSSFKCKVYSVNRIYMTQMKYGDNSLVHNDTHGKKGDENRLTAVIFLNPEWKSDWGGELIFFDRTQDAVCCVSPRPGRVVISQSSVHHRAGIPSRLFFDHRLSLVIMMGVTPIPKVSSQTR